MAKLNPNLIFSMISDLNDLHNIGREMMCIDGNCEIVSWKYPDKLMKDIEIDTCTLVETWDKYVLLLELIIDRLYQVMCLSTTIMDSLPQLSNTFKLPKNIQRTSSISLGSVASFFWKRLQVLMIPKNLLSKSSINTEKTNEGTHIANCVSCHLAIKMVKRLISTLEDCLKEIALPSKITDQRKILEKEIFELSQSEAMELWINAIDFDLKKLTTFSNKNSLKSKDYKKELDLIKVSNDRNIELLRLAQIKYANLEKQYKDDKNQIRDLTDLNNTLEQKYDKIAADLKLSAESCTKVEAKLQELQNILNKTKADNETTITNLKSEYSKQITRISNEKDQWIEISGKRKQQIDELETQLKLQRKKQTEAETKVRQDFDKEKQKVTEEKLMVEKANEKLLKKLEIQMKDNSKIVELTEELYKAKQEIEEYKEREIFLVRYPDLNGSIDQNHINKCKMDPFQDMEQQLVANEIRIHLLQEQNVSLRRTVSKMKAINSSTRVDCSRKCDDNGQHRSF